MSKLPEIMTDEDIKQCKHDFNKDMETYYKDQQIITRWNMDRIQDVIEKIESGNAYYYMNKYSVKMVKGKKVLTKKNKYVNKIVRIVPTEEYFDILYDIHISTGHGGRDKIHKALKTTNDSLYIPNNFASMLLKNCKICKSRPTKKTPWKEPHEYTRGFLHIIDMSKTPCGSYNYIMYYQDLKTSFSFLRALTTISHEEIGMELTKIFLEFGGPAVLSTTKGELFTMNIIDTLRNLHPDIIILSGKKIDREEQEDRENRVKNHLATWMSGKTSQNWYLGIHFVQFNLNNSVDEDLDGTPFEAVVGSTPKIGVDTSEVPENIARKWKHENDLIKWKSDPKRQRVQKSHKTSKVSGQKEEKNSNDDNDASDSEERVWCWVCEKDDDLVTFVCNYCNGSIHLACGKYKLGGDDVLVCKLCLSELNVCTKDTKVEIHVGNINQMEFE